MHDQRVEVVGQAFGGGGVAAAVELVDERVEPVASVGWAGGVIECFPVGVADPFAVAFGQLGQQVPEAVNRAVLAIRRRPALLDGFDQAGGAIADDQQRGSEPAGDQIAPELKPVRVRLAHPERHRQKHPLARFGEPPGHEHALLGPVRTHRQEHRVEEQRHDLDVVEVTAGEVLIALPELLADPRRGRFGQASEPRLGAQRLNVAHR